MKNTWKVFLIELLFFAATLLLGIFVTLRLQDIFQIVEAETLPEEGSLTPFSFLAYFVIATGLVYLISKSEKFKKSRVFFFRIAFLFSVGLGGFLTLSTFIYELLALFIIIILILAWRKKPVILLHNFLVTISIAGIGAVIGRQFDPVTIAVLLALFSVYDFVAVYKTEHMIKMASEMIKTRAIMGIIIPFSFRDLLTDLDKKKKKEFMVLGGGDLAFPLFLIASVTVVNGFFEALVVLLFSCLGLLGSFLQFTSQKKNKAIPALPPIALGCLVGYLFVLLLI